MFDFAAPENKALSSCLGYSCFRVQQASVERCSGRRGQLGELIPHLEPDVDFGAVVGGGHPVPGRAEMWGNTTESGQKPLRCADSAESFHRPFALSGRLVGVLAPIVQVFGAWRTTEAMNRTAASYSTRNIKPPTG